MVDMLGRRLREECLLLVLCVMGLFEGLCGLGLAVEGGQLQGTATPVWVVCCGVYVVLDGKASGRQVPRT